MRRKLGFLNQLTSEAAERLVRPTTNQEIDNALKGIDINKVPGSDGLNSLFFLKAWVVIKRDIYDAVKDLFDTSTLLKQVNTTFYLNSHNPECF